MNGFQLTFFTQQDRRHDGQSLAHWLLAFAKAQGALGGTLLAGGESFGHTGRFHSAHFFELADQPVEVEIVVDAPTCDRLLAALAQEPIDLFYVKQAVEFGRVGAKASTGDRQG